VGEPQVQNSWFRVFRYHFTDRRLQNHDTRRHSIERVPFLSVLSNSHSGTHTNHCQHKFSKWKQHAQNNVYWSHLCPGNLYWNLHL